MLEDLGVYFKIVFYMLVDNIWFDIYFRIKE